LDDFVFPSTWWDLRGHAAEDRLLAEAIEKELHRELAKGHPLHGRVCRALASAHPNDDVVVAVDEADVAIVHLTFTPRRRETPPYPDTEIFGSVDDFAEGLERRFPGDDWD
jgi:hypothetical protein